MKKPIADHLRAIEESLGGLSLVVHIFEKDKELQRFVGGTQRRIQKFLKARGEITWAEQELAKSSELQGLPTTVEEVKTAFCQEETTR